MSERFDVVFFGEDSVGKSSIINRYIKGVFSYENPSQFLNKSINIEGKSIELKIFDTPGQERYRPLTRIYSKNADVCILLYDTTRESTFDEIKNFWFKEIKKYTKPEVSN